MSSTGSVHNVAGNGAALNMRSATPADMVGNQFVSQFYTVLHSTPRYLHRFYTDNSTVIYADCGIDDEPPSSFTVTTQKGISERVSEMGFEEAVTEIWSVDSQYSQGDGVMVMVTGSLQCKGRKKRDFVQSFFLAVQEKGYFVLNDTFRYLSGGTGRANQFPKENGYGHGTYDKGYGQMGTYHQQAQHAYYHGQMGNHGIQYPAAVYSGHAVPATYPNPAGVPPVQQAVAQHPRNDANRGHAITPSMAPPKTAGAPQAGPAAPKPTVGSANTINQGQTTSVAPPAPTQQAPTQAASVAAQAAVSSTTPAGNPSTELLREAPKPAPAKPSAPVQAPTPAQPQIPPQAASTLSQAAPTPPQAAPMPPQAAPTPSQAPKAPTPSTSTAPLPQAEATPEPAPQPAQSSAQAKPPVKAETKENKPEPVQKAAPPPAKPEEPAAPLSYADKLKLGAPRAPPANKPAPAPMPAPIPAKAQQQPKAVSSPAKLAAQETHPAPAHNAAATTVPETSTQPQSGHANSLAGAPEEVVSSSIFVRDLPEGITAEKMEEAFSRFGAIKNGVQGVSVRQQKGKDNYAFVEFEDPAAMKAAIEGQVLIENKLVSVVERRPQILPNKPRTGGYGRGDRGGRGGGEGRPFRGGPGRDDRGRGPRDGGRPYTGGRGGDNPRANGGGRGGRGYGNNFSGEGRSEAGRGRGDRGSGRNQGGRNNNANLHRGPQSAPTVRPQQA